MRTQEQHAQTKKTKTPSKTNRTQKNKIHIQKTTITGKNTQNKTTQKHNQEDQKTQGCLDVLLNFFLLTKYSKNTKK